MCFFLQEEEEAAPVKVQTEFTVKLMKFDDSKKVALIKEVKALIEGMNLVQVCTYIYFERVLGLIDWLIK